MPSTFSTNLKIELMATGENSGTWGTVTNTNLGTALEQAVVGYGNPNYSSDANLTITLTDSNAAQAARALVLNVTSSVSLTGTRELVVPTIQKQYIVQNNTTGSQSITVKTSAGTGVTIPNGKKMHVYVNGTDVVQMDDFALIFNVDNLTLDGNTLSSTNTNGNIVIAPNGTGDVQLDADTVRVGDSNANATITTNGTGDLILNTNAGTNSGSITIEDGVNGNIIIAPNGTGQVQITNAALDLTTIEVSNINAKDGTAAITIADSTGAVGISTAVTMSATTQNIALGTSQTTGTFTVGGAAQTGTQTFDQSTKTHTLNLGTGATESGLTKTVNIGTGGVATSTTAITIGSANGTTTTLNGTVTAATLNSTTIDTTNIEVTNIKAKDGTAALSIADSTGVVSVSANPVLSGGTANGVVYLNASKVATSGSALTYDGSYFTAASGTGAFFADIMQVSGTATKVNANGVGLEFRGGATPNITSYSRVGSAYLPVTLDALTSTFSISGTERMRLNSTSLNIGGNFTSTNNTLQVTGNAAIGYTTAAPTTGLIVAGNVGVGTDAPTRRFVVEGTDPSTNSRYVVAQLARATSGTAAAGIGGSLQLLAEDDAGTQREAALISWDLSNVSAAAPQGRLYLGTRGSNDAVVIDNSGNLGLGVTPSAWGSLNKAIQFGRGFIQTDGSGTGNSGYGRNAYQDGSWYYQASGYANMLNIETDGAFKFFTAPSWNGTGSNAISFTQAMTLDASGNLVVGNTSALGKLDIGLSGTARRLLVTYDDSLVTVKSAGSTANPEVLRLIGDVVQFNTGTVGSGTERARITSGGYFKASNTGGYDNVNGTFHELLNNDSGDPVVQVIHFGATSPNGIKLDFTAASPDDNTQYFLRCADSTAARCFIYSDGDLANHDGVYGTISDQRLKQDIVDAGSQWADIKAIRFRKYRMKSDVAANPNAPALLGVVAQELEQVSPGLVDEHFDADGEVTKTVKSSILLMKAAVALQEAMARIEKLEAEVAALKGV